MRIEAEAKIIDCFYRGACDSAELENAIVLLARHFDSPSACLGEQDGASRERWMIGCGTMGSDQLARYNAAVEHDPAPRAFRMIKVGTASTTDRMFSEHECRRSLFLHEYLRPAGLDHSLASPLYSDARFFGLVGVHQAVHRKKFDDEDIASLERLSPHLARAMQLRRSFVMMKQKEETYEALIERRKSGLIGVREDGAVLFCNHAAHMIAKAADGITLDRAGHPVIAGRPAAAAFAKLRADVMQGGDGGYLRIPRPSGAKPYVTMVSRLPGGMDTTLQGAIGILYSILDPGLIKTPPVQVVADVLELPIGAAKLVRALLEGDDLKSYAERASLSLNTVRSHLKVAFARTDTHSQADLVRDAAASLHATDFALQRV